MSAPKTINESIAIALLASTTGKVDQWKLAGLCGVPKTTVENWLRNWERQKTALVRRKMLEGVLDGDGEVVRDLVEAGRSTGPGKKAQKVGKGQKAKKVDQGQKVKQESPGVAPAGLHGTAGGRIVKGKGSEG